MKPQQISTLLVILGAILVVDPALAQRFPDDIPRPPRHGGLRPPIPPVARDRDFRPSDRRYERFRDDDFRRSSRRNYRSSSRRPDISELADLRDRLDDVLTDDQADELRDSLRDGESLEEALADLDLSDRQQEELWDSF
jgi:hypothetical protein